MPSRGWFRPRNLIFATPLVAILLALGAWDVRHGANGADDTFCAVQKVLEKRDLHGNLRYRFVCAGV